MDFLELVYNVEELRMIEAGFGLSERCHGRNSAKSLWYGIVFYCENKVCDKVLFPREHKNIFYI